MIVYLASSNTTLTVSLTLRLNRLYADLVSAKMLCNISHEPSPDLYSLIFEIFKCNES